MLGIVVLVLVWQVYKAAKESGRNGILWGVGAFFGSLFFQLAIGIAAGVMVAIGIEAWNWPENSFDTISLPLTLVTLVLNGLLLWIVIRYLNKVPDAPGFQAPPPPPPPSF
jgi:hypothetical protein